MSYLIRRAKEPVRLEAEWDSPGWSHAETLTVGIFREDRGGDHRPVTQCRLVYDDAGIHGLFRVQDRYVRSLVTRFQGSVCRDSCVEFFVEPAGGKGYLNFEFNAGGAFLVYHVIDPTRGEGGFRDFRPLTEPEVAGVRMFHTLPSTVEPEIAEDTVWRLGFHIPYSVFAGSTGIRPPVAGQVWRANFYKCGDGTSHPHWASWQPLTATNFHLPDCFGPIIFEDSVSGVRLVQ